MCAGDSNILVISICYRRMCHSQNIRISNQCIVYNWLVYNGIYDSNEISTQQEILLTTLLYQSMSYKKRPRHISDIKLKIHYLYISILLRFRDISCQQCFIELSIACFWIKYMAIWKFNNNSNVSFINTRNRRD